ncbi:MAG: hypothetical protein Q9160_006659 [Pyrenula sp. 1 TL-2023]
MPSSVSSYFGPYHEETDGEAQPPRSPRTGPPSPQIRRHSTRFSDHNLRAHLPTRMVMNENTDEGSALLAHPDGVRPYTVSGPPTPQGRRETLARSHSIGGGSIRFMSRNHSRANSWGHRIASMAGFDTTRNFNGPLSAKTIKSLFLDERVWYDQFTSTDWVHDSIADGHRVQELRQRKDFRGRLNAWFDGAQGWILVAIIGLIVACIAYCVDVTEAPMFDIKQGYCTTQWNYSLRNCCDGREECEAWLTWGEIIQPSKIDSTWINFTVFTLSCIVLALVSCILTLLSKTVVPSNVALSTLDENLGADKGADLGEDDTKSSISPTQDPSKPPNMAYYSAAGSGVAEVRVILSGFVLHGYLGLRTLILKTLGLVFSVASGMSLGKEGPYVHIATCVGNIACRLFSKYNHNDAKRREVLSASAASGVGVAFGAPISGVLFGLEEVAYYFPPKTLFRTFFCCIVAALSLKFLNPYGTGKIVIFEIRYVSDWEVFELVLFAFVGGLGGLAGALFIKASRIWAMTFRRIRIIKKRPMLEVGLVALVTGVLSFWNRYTKLAVTELLLELASPCDPDSLANTGLCPKESDIPYVIRYLLIAFVIKAFLTIITFGIKVPAGIYVPSMVVGGLMGRIVGHTVQYLSLQYPDFFLFSSCPATGGIERCITPGVYALVAAGATMCGVTRLSVTLAVILFELTGSLDHVLPFSLGVLTAKWVADAIEPLSIYDLLTDMNHYPFLDNKMHPVFDTELADIVPATRTNRIIDISNSPLVRATDLREKLEYLQNIGELDGGLPIVRNGVLVGLIPAPDLEFALDRLDDEDNTLCMMATDIRWAPNYDSDDSEMQTDPSDMTPYIDPAPVALDWHSPMDLVYQCFVKLGLRYMCVLRDGSFAGLVHKKTFVKYVKDLEKAEMGH